MTWQRAAELLERQEYGQVAQLLQEQQEAVQQSGQMSLVILLAAACQLCLTCQQFRADRELHQLGLEKARRRERESRRQIQAVLTMLSQVTSPAELAAGEADLDYGIRQSPVEAQEPSVSEKPSTLLQKVKHLLGLEPTTTETAAVTAPASLGWPEPDSPASIHQEALPAQLQQFIASTIEEEMAKISRGSLADQTAYDDELSETGASSTGRDTTKVEQPALSEGSAGEQGAEEGQVSTSGDVSAGEQATDEAVSHLDDTSTGGQVARVDETPKSSAGSTGIQEAEKDKVFTDDNSPSGLAPIQAGTAVSPLSARRQPSTSIESSDSDTPSLVVYCLGLFQAFLNEQPIEKWPSGKGKSIFKYLVYNRHRPAPKEVLMDLFWPDADPDSARNNLNVAIYGLRQALRNVGSDFPHVLFRDDSYLLNPALNIWLDVEEFTRQFKLAKQLERSGLLKDAIKAFHTAEVLFQGEFLAEDLYEEWLTPMRQQLNSMYFELLERLSRHYYEKEDYASSMSICRSMLRIDPCSEVTHRQLMLCYYRHGQHHLALRQYHHCAKALKDELNVMPSPETTELCERIRRHEQL